MSEREQAVNRWAKLLQRKEDRQLFHFAFTGDGSSAATADVSNRPNWAWVRYNEKQDKASQVLNLRFPGIAQGVPIIVGKQYPHDRYFQILGINTELYYHHSSAADWLPYLSPAHGSTHTAVTGSDPAWMNLRNLLPGRLRETIPASLSVFTEYLTYEYNGAIQTWPGGNIDLTDSVPGVAGMHRFVVVSINGATNTLVATDGADAPLPIAPALPSVPVGYVPLAVILTENGMTEIEEADISDYRLIFSSVSGYVQSINRLLSLLEAEFDFRMTRHVVEGA